MRDDIKDYFYGNVNISEGDSEVVMEYPFSMLCGIYGKGQRMIEIGMRSKVDIKLGGG